MRSGIHACNGDHGGVKWLTRAHGPTAQEAWRPRAPPRSAPGQDDRRYTSTGFQGRLGCFRLLCYSFVCYLYSYARRASSEGSTGDPESVFAPGRQGDVLWRCREGYGHTCGDEGQRSHRSCYRTHDAADAEEEVPLLGTGRGVRFGVGQPVSLVCGSSGKRSERVTKPPEGLFGCGGAGHRNDATARRI